LLAVPLGLLLMFSRSAWNDLPPVGTVLFTTGLVLVAIGSMGRLWCSLYIAGHRNGTLVTLGPYSISRNPLYFFSLVGALGVAFGSQTILIPAGTVLVFALLYWYVIRMEETKLSALHGDSFKDYCKTTTRFFPDFSRLKEPEAYPAHPVAFRSDISSALWFIWLLCIFELIEVLQALELLPVFFEIY
ncbi:MAG TPA: isoprenylcysteine carboxylmethyltransferase family protein, partial [Candidatus Binatia bacterium]